MTEGNVPEGDIHDVAIVGLGPTGATLAGLLGLCGLSVLVLERDTAIYDLPRAVHFDDEVMRVFQTLGIAGEVAKTTRVNIGMRFVDSAGKLLLDWPRPTRVGPQGWHASYRFHQPDLEQTLRARLSQMNNIDVRTGTEVLRVEDRGDRVVLQLKPPGAAESRFAAARYVVGCDGARSLVRRAMGAAMEDLGFHERWLVVDVLLRRPKPELGDHSIQYCDPHRPATYCRSPGMRRRWEITVRDDEESHAIAETDSVWNLLKDWLTPDEADIERRAVYTFHSTLARKWRAGRLLIAGDAAHQTPPFMGQGMCAGIRDAANLAWKLALCARGLAAADLLDTYGDERRPHARAYIDTAIRLGGLINTMGTGKALDAAFRQPDGSARMESLSAPLGNAMPGATGAHAGRLFSQPRLSDGRLLDDVCGYAPVLLVDGTLREAAGNPPLTVLDSGAEPAIGESLAAVGAAAVLVRPDRYVLGTADTREGVMDLLAHARATFADGRIGAWAGQVRGACD